jgi:hypothetical protein
MPSQWQIRFDDGHQQRYLPDRVAVLRYVLGIGASKGGELRASSTRFEVFTESAPVLLADGSPGGRAFALAEVIDLSRPGETQRLQAELAAAQPGPAGGQQGPAGGSPGPGGPREQP